MKRILFLLYRILIALVLIGKAANWVLHFSHETNRLLNMAMFSLIGIAFIVQGYVWHNKFTKTIITLCGLFLIAVNFFDENMILDIIGIICILTPILIARFYKEQPDEMSVTN
jgi:hypothetical protein